MLRELAELREDAAQLAAGLSRARYRRAAGLPAEETFAALLEAHALAAGPDGVAQAREALGNARGEDPKRPGRIARLATLLDFLARVRALALEPAAAQELFDVPQRRLVRPPGDEGLHGALPAVSVARELARARSRERRAELEAALASALQPADGARSAAWDAALAAQSEAGLLPPPGTAPWAEGLLSRTEAIFEDLGRWVLERNTGARPGQAARHDVLHLLHAPRCAPAFLAGELERTVRRWAAMLPLDLSAVKLDGEDRPLKWPGAIAEPLDPPFQAAITFLPAEGPRALEDLLAALGVAFLRLGPPADAPPEDLWLGDRAVREASAALLSGLVRDPGWLRRCAGIELARDDERAIAVAAVVRARVDAARALASLQARDSGLGARAAAAHRDLYAKATGADLPAGLSLCGLDPWADALARLQGRALAARAAAFLRERYDEDWWRNPRSTQSLQGLWARGGRPTCTELWAEMGGEPGIDPLVLEFCGQNR
ncbi:MAG TPA: hypothetical protein VMK66_16055 [Myxococcales bacterium]|nr:hypothetical protein [Myxococcales bacterium]